MSAKLLVVDDEPLIALDLEGMLMDAGYEVVAIARDIESARQHIDQSFVNLVILDADLNGTSSEPLARHLRSTGVPFVVASGYSANQLEWLGDTHHITKPIDQNRLLDAVKTSLSGSSNPHTESLADRAIGKHLHE